MQCVTVTLYPCSNDPLSGVLYPLSDDPSTSKVTDKQNTADYSGLSIGTGVDVREGGQRRCTRDIHAEAAGSVWPGLPCPADVAGLLGAGGEPGRAWNVPPAPRRAAPSEHQLLSVYFHLSMLVSTFHL